jgi:hypothetical protein
MNQSGCAKMKYDTAAHVRHEVLKGMSRDSQQIVRTEESLTQPTIIKLNRMALVILYGRSVSIEANASADGW